MGLHGESGILILHCFELTVNRFYSKSVQTPDLTTSPTWYQFHHSWLWCKVYMKGDFFKFYKYNRSCCPELSKLDK